MESDSRSLRQGDGTLEELMRERIRATIETLIDEELEAALGAGRSQRVGGSLAWTGSYTTSATGFTVGCSASKLPSSPSRAKEFTPG
jgi:hypothetical protein